MDDNKEFLDEVFTPSRFYTCSVCGELLNTGNLGEYQSKVRDCVNGSCPNKAVLQDKE